MEVHINLETAIDIHSYTHLQSYYSAFPTYIVVPYEEMSSLLDNTGSSISHKNSYDIPKYNRYLGHPPSRILLEVVEHRSTYDVPTPSAASVSLRKTMFFSELLVYSTGRKIHQSLNLAPLLNLNSALAIPNLFFGRYRVISKLGTKEVACKYFILLKSRNHDKAPFYLAVMFCSM